MNSMTASYRQANNQSFNLLGADAFKVSLTNVVGRGNLLVLINEGSLSPVPVELSSQGEVIYPFSNLRGFFNLAAVSRISFRFEALSADFSVTAHEIAIVPEVSSAWLAGLGSAACLLRRRRGWEVFG